MGDMGARTGGEETVSKRRVWMVRAVVVGCVGLGALIGGVVLQSHYRERRVAEFVRRFQGRGGSVERGYGSDLSQWLVKLRWGLGDSLFGRALKEPRPEIVGLGRSFLAKEEFSILGDLPYLRELYLEATPLTSELSASLNRARSLEDLAFRKSGATDQTFGELCRALEKNKKLHSLHLLESQITDEGIKELSRLKNVTSVAIESPHLTGESLRLLAGRPMRYVSLNGWKLTARDVSYLSDQWSGTLEGVSMGGKQISASMITPLQECRLLRSLSLRDVDLTPELMGNLKKVYSLLDLTLEKTVMEQKGMEILAGLPMNSLTLSDAGLPKQGLRLLGRNQKVSNLTLSGLQIGDEEIADLLTGARSLTAEKKRSKISSLNFNKTAITDRGIRELEALPELYGLVLQECAMTDVALDAIGLWDLRQRSEWFYLNVRGTKVTPEGVKRLKIKQPRLVFTASSEF